MDNAAHWINHGPVDSVVSFASTSLSVSDLHVIYPVDSVIHPLNNHGLQFMDTI